MTRQERGFDRRGFIKAAAGGPIPVGLSRKSRAGAPAAARLVVGPERLHPLPRTETLDLEAGGRGSRFVTRLPAHSITGLALTASASGPGPRTAG